MSSCSAAPGPQSADLARAGCDALLVNARFLPALDTVGFPRESAVQVEVDWGAAVPAAWPRATTAILRPAA